MINIKRCVTRTALIVPWLLLLTAPLQAEHLHPPSPDEIPGSIKLDAEGVIGVANRVDGLVIIDSRISTDRRQGYIEGSISLPNEETSCGTLAMHIKDLHSPVLFYCNGVMCGRSADAVKRALACGYEVVYWFRGGFEEWKAKRYPYIKE